MIPVPGLAGRRVAVFGLGRSGMAAARALKAGGAIPVPWDDGVSGRLQAEAEGFEVEDLARAEWPGFAALVLSPGLPLTHPVPHWSVTRARAAGVEVIGDIELFARAIVALPEGARPKVVGITGTNGKSTTTALLGWVLKQAGLKTHVGGNIGIGVLALPAPTPGAVYVLEVSSYQLDLTTSFAPDVAILTNITPDHLDRHGGMDGYVAAKARLFQALAPGATALVGVDEPETRAVAEALGERAVSVATAPSSTRGEGKILAAPGALNIDGHIIDLSPARSLPGRHNAQNAAFAFAAARALGVPEAAAVNGLLTFPGLAHRMETIGILGEVRFVNDSKATNADAARQALASYDRVFWIAGGRAKAGGIADLTDLFPRVTRAYLIGEAAGDFAATLGDTPHAIAGDLAAAVAAAAQDAAGVGGPQVVLLSPAAASFDQFPDFEVRGEAFRTAALALGAVPPGASA
ncbi:MAG: UDP-N-acetylmuramoyl-L-alanine--D-glutamate ligase [Brevundimonas sp.]|uniref:UDP-N-acetylmuramoyl-L-alanine--D-glutamate ligase n=2 Tax=Brevundimonas sp. TaxID=1871086 RepID=UPI00391FC08F